MTIVEAIIKVLKSNKGGLSSQEIYNKIVESKLYQFKAQVPVGVVNQQVRRHCYGLDFPSASAIKYFQLNDIRKKTIYSLLEKDTTILQPQRKTAPSTRTSEDLLPEEQVMNAYEKHIINIRSQLLEEILNNDPVFFEKMVVDLLIKLGCGYDYSGGIVTGKAHDGGIDGIIYEDRLGLDKIYIQAKRYGSKNVVGRNNIQAFVGAMENVQKGVFITTSTLTKEAISYAERQQQKNIKLIDGKLLTELMVKHSVGVTQIKNLAILKIDQDYFIP